MFHNNDTYTFLHSTMNRNEKVLGQFLKQRFHVDNVQNQGWLIIIK